MKRIKVGFFYMLLACISIASSVALFALCLRTQSIFIHILLLVAFLANIITAIWGTTVKENDFAISVLLLIFFPLALPIYTAYYVYKRISYKRYKRLIYPKNPYQNLQNLDRNLQKICKISACACSHHAHTFEDGCFIDTAEEGFTRLMSALNEAHTEILLSFYILERGFLLNKLINILCQKAEQNVQVKLLYDTAGCFLKLGFVHKKRLKKSGVKLIKFRPIGGNANHCKLAIIDGDTLFLMSANVGDNYINRAGDAYMKDCALMLKGAIAQDARNVFCNLNMLADKKYAHLPKLQHTATIKNSFCQLFTMGFAKHNAHEIFESLLCYATHSIFLVTPYYTFDGLISNTLIRAAHAGLDVRVVIPAKNNKRFEQIIALKNMQLLIKEGVKVEVFDGFIHSKLVLIDNVLAVCGSNNLNHRSFYCDLECGAILYNNSAVTQICEDIYKNIFPFCVSLKPQKLSAMQKLFFSVIKLLTPKL